MTFPGDDWTGQGLLHEGCIYGSDEELAERCVPFVQDGLGRSEAVVFFATEPARQVVLDALGPDRERLALVLGSDDAWRTGHRMLLFWDQMFTRLSGEGRPWRVLAEPAWLAGTDGRPWHRFESVVNEVYSSLPCYSLCLHDRRRLPDDALAEVARTHPVLCAGGHRHHSPAYTDPAEYVPTQEPAWTPVPAGAVRVAVADASEGRAAVTSTVLDQGLDDRLDDVAVAVTEIVVNAVEAGGRPVVSAWGTPDGVVIEVADGAGGGIDPLAGYRPPGQVEETGRGLWLARALADDAAVRSGPDGSAVRMWFGPGPTESRPH